MTIEIRRCDNCPDSWLEKQRFCGKTVVEDEICFVPGIHPNSICKVEILNPDLRDFKVELVCCSLIVISGILTKRITFTNHTCLEQDFTFQASIPVEIDDPDDIDPHEWRVTGVEVCDGCFKLLCASAEGKFHKLREKDIVLIQVDHVDC